MATLNTLGAKSSGTKLLVIVVDLLGAIEPTDRIAHRGLGFDQHQRQAIDKQHQVGAPFGVAGPEGVLSGGDILVAVEIVEIDQAHGDVLVVLPKGHRALAAQPGGELLVGADQAIRAHREHDGAQFVEHFIGAFGLGGDLGVQADEGFAQRMASMNTSLVRRGRASAETKYQPAPLWARPRGM